MAGSRPPVFVYGTLRPGMGLHDVIEPYMVAHQPARLAGFGLYINNVPYVLPAPERGSFVRGDLIELARSSYRQALGELDTLEGYSPRAGYAYYIRALVPVFTTGWKPVPAWVYLAGGSRCPDERLRVASGDYAQFIRERRRDSPWSHGSRLAQSRHSPVRRRSPSGPGNGPSESTFTPSTTTASRALSPASPGASPSSSPVPTLSASGSGTPTSPAKTGGSLSNDLPVSPSQEPCP